MMLRVIENILSVICVIFVVVVWITQILDIYMRKEDLSSTIQS